MFLLISFTTSYSFYDGLLMFMYHFVTKIYLHLLPILFFWIRNEAWTDLVDFGYS